MLQLPDHRGKRFALLSLAVFFVVAGVNHFRDPDFYLAMMPPYLPAHQSLVAASGLFEIVGGLAVLIPRVRSVAGWGLALLLVSVFPANLHMATNPELFPAVPTLALYARLPLQLALIAWAIWATRTPESTQP